MPATKKNNVWSALTKPIVDRPGMPAPEAVRAAAREAQHMPAHLIALGHTRARADKRDNPCRLPPRQVQVLDLLVQGLTPTEVARELGLSKSMVSKYTSEIRERMGVDTIAQAVLAWHRHYRVLQPDAKSGNKDHALIDNLQRAIDAAQRLKRKQAA